MISRQDISDGDLVVLSALKKQPFYGHAAVYSAGRFYHFNESGGHCDSYDFFVNQQQRRILRIEHGTKTHDEIQAYYDANKHRTWKALTYNCEHFAYGAAYGAEKSPTLRGYVALVGTVVGALIIGLFVKRKTK